MGCVAVLVPALQRPHRVAPLAASLDASVILERAAGWEVCLCFVCSPDDPFQIQAVRAAGLDPVIARVGRGARGQYARKINHAAAGCDADWLLLAADDLHFHPGWLTAALAEHERTGALVIGTNDLTNPTVIAGRHATHSLVHRDYLPVGTIDEPGKLLHEGYDHNSVDVEFVETARARGMFAFAAGSHVEHLHHLWGKSARDATYRKGVRRANSDKRLCAARRALWTG